MRPLPRPLPRGLPVLRRPRPSTLWIGVTAVLTFWFVADLAGDAEAARDRWGRATPVAVSATELAAGDVVGPGDVELAEVPAAVVPDGAVLTDPVGLTVRSRVGRGEILVEHRIGGAAGEGLSALLERGQRGVAVPTTGLDLPVEVGDHVDVLATLGPMLGEGQSGGGGDPTRVLTERARVIAVDDDGVTIAVSAYDATTITHALVNATVTLTLTV